MKTLILLSSAILFSCQNQTPPDKSNDTLPPDNNLAKSQTQSASSPKKKPISSKSNYEELLRAEKLVDKGGFDEAFRIFKRVAESGDVEGQFQLYQCYLEGIGTKIDHAQGNSWLKKAADGNHDIAQFTLGNYYYEGTREIKVNHNLALLWFRKAADQGLPRAIFNVGVCYGKGHGTAPDRNKAFKYFVLAAEKDYKPALPTVFQIGWFYENGFDGFPKSPEKAFEHYKLTAEKGYAKGQHKTGLCYQKGLGIKTDSEKAKSWLKKAADQGYHPDSEKDRN